MMCHEAREALLTADRSTLRMHGSSALAGHLRTCDPCRAEALRLERVMTLMAAAVAERADVHVRAPRRASSRRRRTAMLVLVPLTAAAVVVAMVRREAPASAPIVVHDDSVAAHVAVDVRRGQTATVMKTSNPNVTIVWLTPGGTE